QRRHHRPRGQPPPLQRAAGELRLEVRAQGQHHAQLCRVACKRQLQLLGEPVSLPALPAQRKKSHGKSLRGFVLATHRSRNELDFPLSTYLPCLSLIRMWTSETAPLPSSVVEFASPTRGSVNFHTERMLRCQCGGVKLTTTPRWRGGRWRAGSALLLSLLSL